MRRGGEGRNRPMREADDKHRGGLNAAHKLLQEVQFRWSTAKSSGSLDIGDEADSQATFGFSEIVEVDAV